MWNFLIELLLFILIVFTIYYYFLCPSFIWCVQKSLELDFCLRWKQNVRAPCPIVHVLITVCLCGARTIQNKRPRRRHCCCCTEQSDVVLHIALFMIKWNYELAKWAELIVSYHREHTLSIVALLLLPGIYECLGRHTHSSAATAQTGWNKGKLV